MWEHIGMEAKSSPTRTSPEELEAMMQHPSETRIRAYAEEVLGDPLQAQQMLAGKDLRQVLTTLIQIDYGVVA